MGLLTVPPVNLNIETRVTARANGVYDRNGNKVPKNPVYSEPENSCHGVCGSMLNPSWRTKANDKPYTIHNRSSDSFCV